MGQKAAQRGGWVDGREPLGGGLDWERRVRPKSSMGGVDLLGQGGVFGWGGEGVGEGGGGGGEGEDGMMAPVASVMEVCGVHGKHGRGVCVFTCAFV